MRTPPSLICVMAWSLVWLSIEPQRAIVGAPLMLAAWWLARVVTPKRGVK